MIWFIDFMVGFVLMVAGCSLVVASTIASTYAGRWLGWRFRQASLSREAQRVLARQRVRERVID